MPGRDGTGPMGAGPLTGWGRGFCVGTRPLGYGRGIRRGAGRGRGFWSGAWMGAGYGCGRGFGRYWWGLGPDVDPKEMLEKEREWEKEDLEAERELLKKRLEMIDAQLGSENDME